MAAERGLPLRWARCSAALVDCATDTRLWNDCRLSVCECCESMDVPRERRALEVPGPRVVARFREADVAS